jgi:hypothetical protein
MLANVDQLIRSKRKTIAILIQLDGKVIVRAPLRAPERLIRTFVESKSAWINEKKALALKQVASPVRQFKDGEKFWLLGEQIPLRVVEGQRAALNLQDEFLLSKKAQPQALKVFEEWYKARALRVLSERANLLAARHGFHFEKIRISSARTRWGSCSSRGTLSFTWRLVMAPLEVVDYVVIHELAHLKIKNHSAQFWGEVARLMPGFKTSRDWLKKNGRLLTLAGES